MLGTSDARGFTALGVKASPPFLARDDAEAVVCRGRAPGALALAQQRYIYIYIYAQRVGSTVHIHWLIGSLHHQRRPLLLITLSR